jgi:hypothetical protein
MSKRIKVTNKVKAQDYGMNKQYDNAEQQLEDILKRAGIKVSITKEVIGNIAYIYAYNRQQAMRWEQKLEEMGFKPVQYLEQGANIVRFELSQSKLSQDGMKKNYDGEMKTYKFLTQMEVERKYPFDAEHKVEIQATDMKEALSQYYKLLKEGEIYNQAEYFIFRTRHFFELTIFENGKEIFAERLDGADIKEMLGISKKKQHDGAFDDVNELYEELLDRDLFTESELELLTNVCGYNVGILNDALYARHGYRSLAQMLGEDEDDEDEEDF